MIPVIRGEKICAIFRDLCDRTKHKGKRHRGIYKLTLIALNRPKEEIQKMGVKGVLRANEIDFIEKTLASAERRGLYATIMGTILWYCRKHKLMLGAWRQS